MVTDAKLALAKSIWWCLRDAAAFFPPYFGVRTACTDRVELMFELLFSLRSLACSLLSLGASSRHGSSRRSSRRSSRGSVDAAAYAEKLCVLLSTSTDVVCRVRVHPHHALGGVSVAKTLWRASTHAGARQSQVVYGRGEGGTRIDDLVAGQTDHLRPYCISLMIPQECSGVCLRPAGASNLVGVSFHSFRYCWVGEEANT